MQPLSAVVADVLGQLKLEGVKPEDCRLTLASGRQGEGSGRGSAMGMPFARRTCSWRGERLTVWPWRSTCLALHDDIRPCCPTRRRHARPSRTAMPPHPPLRSSASCCPCSSQKGQALDLGLPLRFANIGRNDKLELTTGEGKAGGGRGAAVLKAAGAAAGWCGMSARCHSSRWLMGEAAPWPAC